MGWSYHLASALSHFMLKDSPLSIYTCCAELFALAQVHRKSKEASIQHSFCRKSCLKNQQSVHKATFLIIFWLPREADDLLYYFTSD